MSYILALKICSGGSGQIHDKMPLPKLIELLFYRHHLEAAHILGLFELLHVQGSQTGPFKGLRHDTKQIAHEDLVHSVAGEQVSKGQLDVVLVIGNLWH